MTQPKSGEWWQVTDGTRVYIIGVRLSGRVMHEMKSGWASSVDDWEDWTHLPDCDSFDWVPNVS